MISWFQNLLSNATCNHYTEDVAGLGLDARFAALARIFDMASDESKVDHPMCLEVGLALHSRGWCRICYMDYTGLDIGPAPWLWWGL